MDPLCLFVCLLALFVPFPTLTCVFFLMQPITLQVLAYIVVACNFQIDALACKCSY